MKTDQNAQQLQSRDATGSISEAPTTQPESLTFGMRAVGMNFNPSGKPEVNAIKEKSATLIDELNHQFEKATDGEVKAQFKLAIRAVQEAQMWGVKAATWL